MKMKKVMKKIRKRGAKARSTVSKKGARARKRTRSKSAATADKFPTLADFNKTVPKGGLLNSGLRKNGGINVSKIDPNKKPKGDFKNVGI